MLCRWFVDREIELFRLKFDSLTLLERQNFLQANNLNYIPLNGYEIQKEICGNDDYSDDQQNEFKNKQFFKVRFTEVLSLVSARKCILKDGYAYVTDLSFIVETIHKKFIEKGLLSTYRMMNVIKEDVRIVDLLKTIHSSRPGHDFELNDETCNFIESADYLSSKYFPLCARMCHESLRERHHLKYFGRNQYQLFLKGIGVSLEDSLKLVCESALFLLSSLIDLVFSDFGSKNLRTTTKTNHWQPSIDIKLNSTMADGVPKLTLLHHRALT